MNPYQSPTIPSDTPATEPMTWLDAFAVGIALGIWVTLAFIAAVHWYFPVEVIR